MARPLLLLFAGSLLAGTTLLAACAEDDLVPESETLPVEIPFAALLGNAPLDPTTAVAGVGTTGALLQVYDARFYVSDVALVTVEGTRVEVTLGASPWQAEGVTLIDLTDLEKETGTKGVNNHVAGTVPAGTYTGLRFTVGVPFESNHTFLDTAPSPLNLTSMNWSWRGGRKFVHIVGVVGNDTGVFVHVGSTGCQGEVDAITGCDHPNRMTVELPWSPGQSVTMDLDALFADLDIRSNTEETPSLCMAAPTDPECGPIFDVMGLPFGDQLAAPQRLFRASDDVVTAVRTGAGEDEGGDAHADH